MINEQDRLFHAKMKATYLKLCSLDSCILAFFTCEEKTVRTRLLWVVLARISTRSPPPADPTAASQHRKPHARLQKLTQINHLLEINNLFATRRTGGHFPSLIPKLAGGRVHTRTDPPSRRHGKGRTALDMGLKTCSTMKASKELDFTKERQNTRGPLRQPTPTPGNDPISLLWAQSLMAPPMAPFCLGINSLL